MNVPVFSFTILDLESQFKGCVHTRVTKEFSNVYLLSYGLIFYTEIFDPLGVYSELFFPFLPSIGSMGFSVFPFFHTYFLHQFYLHIVKSQSVRCSAETTHPARLAVDRCICQSDINY